APSTPASSSGSDLRRSGDEHDFDASIALPALFVAVGGGGSILGEAGGGQPIPRDLRVILEEADDVGGASRGELPVGGIALAKLGRDDAGAVRVAADLDDAVLEARERAGDLEQDLPPLLFDLRLAGVEQDLVRDVDDEIVAAPENGDVAALDFDLEVGREVFLQAIERLDRLLLLLLHLRVLGGELVALALELRARLLDLFRLGSELV